MNSLLSPDLSPPLKVVSYEFGMTYPIELHHSECENLSLGPIDVFPLQVDQLAGKSHIGNSGYG